MSAIVTNGNISYRAPMADLDGSAEPEDQGTPSTDGETEAQRRVGHVHGHVTCQGQEHMFEDSLRRQTRGD